MRSLPVLICCLSLMTLLCGGGQVVHAQSMSSELRIELEILVHYFQPGVTSFEEQKRQYLAALKRNNLPPRSIECMQTRMTRGWQRETMMRDFAVHAGNPEQAHRLNAMLAVPAMRKALSNLSPAQVADANPLQAVSGGKAAFTEEELAQLVLFSDTPEWRIFLRLGALVKGDDFMLDASLALLNQCLGAAEK